MAVKQKKLAQRLRKRLRKVVRGGTTRLRNTGPQLGPAAANDATPPVNNEGVLRLNNNQLRVPTALAEAGERHHDHWWPSTLVLVLTALAVAFISIITWFVAQMPTK